MPTRETKPFIQLQVTKEEARLVQAFRQTKKEVDFDPGDLQKDLGKLMMQLHQPKNESFEVDGDGVYAVYVFFLVCFYMGRRDGQR